MASATSSSRVLPLAPCASGRRRSCEPLHRQVPRMQRGDLWPFGRPTLPPRQGGSGSRGRRLHVRAHQGPAGSGRARRARPRLPPLWAPLVRKVCPGPLQREAPVRGAMPVGHRHHLRVLVRWQKPRSKSRGVAVSARAFWARVDAARAARERPEDPPAPYVGPRRETCWRCIGPLTPAQVDANVGWCGCPSLHVGDEHEDQS
jgi:hypothetical protein